MAKSTACFCKSDSGDTPYHHLSHRSKELCVSRNRSNMIQNYCTGTLITSSSVSFFPTVIRNSPSTYEQEIVSGLAFEGS